MAQFKLDLTLSVLEKGKKRPEYTVGADANGEMSFKDFIRWQREVLIATAIEATKEEQQKGFTKEPIVITDGRVTGDVTAVKPLGNIIIKSAVEADLVLKDIFKGLLYRSKEVTGQYIGSHRVVYNRTQVADDFFSMDAWMKKGIVFNPGDEIIFVNAAPYARKLERLGVTAQRSTPPDKRRRVKSKDKKLRSADKDGKILAPNGTYYLTYRSVSRKFKGNARIEFKLLTGSYLGLAGSFQTARGLGKKKLDPNSKEGKNKRTYLYPSIVITIQKGGTL